MGGLGNSAGCSSGREECLTARWMPVWQGYVAVEASVRH